MLIASLIVLLFVFLLGCSVVFSSRAYNRGVGVRKVLLVQVLSFVLSLFTCSALAAATTCSETSVNAKEQIVQRSESNDSGVVSARKMGDSAEASESQSTSKSDGSRGMGYIAMAICMGLACLGAGIAVASAAPAAIGAVSEDKKSFGTALVFVALAEGVTVFGLLIAIFIYNGINA